MLVKNQKKALALGISTIFMWSTVPTAFKLALMGMSPLQLVALGLFFASLILSLYIVKKKREVLKTLTKKEWFNIFAQGFTLFVYYFFLFSAYDLLPAQITQPINNLWVFALVFINACIIRELPTKGEFIGMLIAYSGAMGLSIASITSNTFSGQISTLGLIYAFASTLFIASYWALNNRSSIDNTVCLWGSFITASFLAFLTIALQDFTKTGNIIENWLIIPSTAFTAVIYLAFFEWAFGFVTWTLALKLTTSITAMGLLSFFNPFISLFWINIFLHEPILPATVIGLILIIIGIIIQQKYQRVYMPKD